MKKRIGLKFTCILLVLIMLLPTQAAIARGNQEPPYDPGVLVEEAVGEGAAETAVEALEAVEAEAVEEAVEAVEADAAEEAAATKEAEEAEEAEEDVEAEEAIEDAEATLAALLAEEDEEPNIPGVPNPNVPKTDFSIINQFGADSPHAQMLVSEHARTMSDFGAAAPNHDRGSGVPGNDRSYSDPHGGSYITTFVGTEYAGQTYLIDGKPYEVCEHGYAVDPIYEKGGYLFTPLYRDEVNLYMIAMDFDDLKGDNYAPYGAQRSVLPFNGGVYDLTYPQVIFNMTYNGNAGLTALPDHIFSGAGTITDGSGIGIVDRLHMMSMGRLQVNAICLNEEYAKLHPDMDALNDKWPWFRAESAMMSYNTQGPAECEDYRQFSRIHQGGVDAAMRALDKLIADVLADRWSSEEIISGTGYADKEALAEAIQKVKDDFENVDSLYTVMPPTTHGYGYGWQAGSGIATAFGYNDQSQIVRDSEYRHEFEARTPGGRMIGGGVFGTMNLTRDFSRVITTWLHEFSHTYGLIDCYSYGSMGTNNGESAGGMSGYSIMNSDANMRSGVDLHAWRKFRMGWLSEDEVLMILPGEKKKVAVLSVSAQGEPGAYDEQLAADLAALGYAPGEVDFVGTRLITIPKEMRSRDTWGMVWNNGWNPNRTAYNWYDWFINSWVGGETYAIKTFPSFYTVESRKRLGVDAYLASDHFIGADGGLIVSYIANSTWETGHGGGAFKGLSGNTPLRKGGTASWSDQNIGLTVTALETGAYFDVVEIEYAAVPQRPEARHVYMGVLTASDSFVQSSDTFSVDFDILTLGNPNANDPNGQTAPPVPTRVASPLGVPAGLAGFEMLVEFDPDAVEYWPAGNALPDGWETGNFNADVTNAAEGVIIVTAAGNRMIDKDVILTLGFKAKDDAEPGDYTIKGVIKDVVLHNWRGEIVRVGDPGFNGSVNGSPVGTIGDGTFATFHAVNTTNLSSEDIKSFGGNVKIGEQETFSVSGRIVCEVPGPLYGLVNETTGVRNTDNYTGVESEITLYNAANEVVATTKSELKGYFNIDGVPNGSYYLTAHKPRYLTGRTSTFQVSNRNVVIRSNEDGVRGSITVPPLKRERYTISGVIQGSPNSDGSGATPLVGVDVYLINIGSAYEVMGGPVKTDAQGRFTVEGLESYHPYAAVAVSVKGTQYESLYIPQINLYPHMNKPFFGVTEKLELTLGLNYGESGQDYRYPQGDTQLNAYGGSRRVYLNPGGCYNIALTSNVIGRNATLVETQDIRLRMQTKSNQISYQLRDMNDNPIGDKVQSLGNNNGDDIIRNVAPGEYYIEASRPGYVSGCTMPFTVAGTRIMLRQSQTANTMDLITEASAPKLSGKVIDKETGESLEGASIVFVPYNASRGKGVPIATNADGEFLYPVVGGQVDIIISKDGYKSETIAYTNLTASVADMEIELEPIAVQYHKDSLEDSIRKTQEWLDETPGNSKKFIVDNQTQPVFQYNSGAVEGTNNDTIFEEVYIEVPVDTDEDGKRDMVRIHIARPAVTGEIIDPDTGETKVSVGALIEHSPYRNQSTDGMDNANVVHDQKANPDTTNYTYEKDIRSNKPRSNGWYWGNKAMYWNGEEWVADADYGKENANGSWFMTPRAGAPESSAWFIPPARNAGEALFRGRWTGTGGGSRSNPSATYQYFYTRGYAIIISSSTGNTFGEASSEGFTNCGDVEETVVAMAVVSWLNGEAKGYTDRTGTKEVVATWCNGNVAMTGQSYVGTIPQAVACSGVNGIKAILPIAAISSWYDYYRGNGAVVAPYNFQGEDADVLTDYCIGRKTSAAFYPPDIKALYESYLAKQTVDQDRGTGDYSWFWDDRNYLTTIDSVPDDCGVMIMHGLNDWNVKTKQPNQFYQALKGAGKQVKQIWHLGAHATVWDKVDSHYMEFYHLWMDHFLYGLDNKAIEEIPEISIPSGNNVNWEYYDQWPIAGSAYAKWYLNAPTAAKAGPFTDSAPTGGTIGTFKDDRTANSGISPSNTGNLTTWENRLFNPADTDKLSSERLAFATDVLEKPIRINGTVKVGLEISADQSWGSISAVLVELGPNYRAYGTAATVPPTVIPGEMGAANITLNNYTISNALSQYKIVTRGYADLQNPNPSGVTYLEAKKSEGFIPPYYYQTKAINPGDKNVYVFETMPMDYTFKAGTRLALYVYGTDYRTTIVPLNPPTFTLYSGINSYVEIPIVPTYSIFYDGNGGTSLYDDLGGYSDSYPLAGQSAKSWNPGYRIPVTTLGNASVVKLNTRPNEFLGWNTKADGTGTMFQPGDVIQEAALGTLATGGAVTFYAQWEILCECELCPICGGCLLGEVCDCMGVDCTCTPCQHMLFEMAVEILKAAKPPVVLPNYKLTPAVTLPQLKAYVEGLVNKGWFEIVIQQKEAGGEYFLVHPDTAWGLEYQIVVELAFQPTHTTEDYDAAIAKAKAFLADSHSLSTPESVNAAKTLLNAFLALDRIAKPDFLMMTYEEQVALAKEILDKIDEAAALLKARLLSATPSAYVTKLTGNQNDLSITVVEKYTYGPNVEYTATLKISNNAAGTYKVGPYNVYVDTKGNTQIKEIYIK